MPVPLTHLPQTKLPKAECYEQVVGEQSNECAWGGFPEETACGLCYTDIKIIKGEIPCHKVYEDELTFAFMDNHPIQPGHVLVVSKNPAEVV